MSDDANRWKQMYELQKERADRLYLALQDAERAGVELALRASLPSWGKYGRPYNEYIKYLADEIIKAEQTKRENANRNRDSELANGHRLDESFFADGGNNTNR